MKKIIIALLLSPTIVFAGDIFMELDHYSQINNSDIGLTMFNVGAEECFKEKFCIDGRLGTPIGDNDMRYDDTRIIGDLYYLGDNWEEGDLIGGISLKYKFYHW